MKRLLLSMFLTMVLLTPVMAKADVGVSSNDISSMFKESTTGNELVVSALSLQEMKETEGALIPVALYYAALPLARAAIWIAPKISSTFRVVGNTAGKNPHTVLLQNNVHRVQIGVDKFGKHVGFGANKNNHARYHIYKK
ncbi:hypothetical protein HY792_05755 [Candidatus Desantisbacteria bacterium]|nr:hypothetical protein [Candidatus Desantisbacteria bacterium]